MTKTNTYEMDMTQGTLLPQILRFSFPLILTNVLQILYSAVDVAVVGRFASAEAMAAVSASSSLIALMTKIFIGLSLGANVLVAQAYGSGDHRRIRESVHTSMLLSLLSGALVMAIGLCLGRPMLKWMNTPDDVLGQAALYVQIYFSGSIFNMVYNYGAAVMRAVGDTKRPMYYLLVSGAVKVILNVLFVAGLGMDVAGVALATVISQLLSAGLILFSLTASSTVIRLDVRKLRLIPRSMLAQLKIGVPEGVQKAMFSISNVLLQSAVNTFGAIAMAGSGAAGNVEEFVYAVMSSFYVSCLTFTSQNVGVCRWDRVKQVIRICLVCNSVSALVLGGGALLFSGPLLGIYTADPAVIAMGVQRLQATAVPYLVLALSEIFIGASRGMGNAFWPMIISIAGICGLRIVWIYGIFPLDPSLYFLYLSYPFSWCFTLAAQYVCYRIVRRRTFRQPADSANEVAP